MYDDKYDYREERRAYGYDRGPSPAPASPPQRGPPYVDYPYRYEGGSGAGRIFPLKALTQMATIGVMVFFVGFIVSNVWLLYEEPQYEYDEWDDYEEAKAEYDWWGEERADRPGKRQSPPPSS